MCVLHDLALHNKCFDIAYFIFQFLYFLSSLKIQSHKVQMHHQFLSSSINVSKMKNCHCTKMYRVSPFDSHLTKQFDMQQVLGFEPFPLPANECWDSESNVFRKLETLEPESWYSWPRTGPGLRWPLMNSEASDHDQPGEHTQPPASAEPWSMPPTRRPPPAGRCIA